MAAELTIYVENLDTYDEVVRASHTFTTTATNIMIGGAWYLGKHVYALHKQIWDGGEGKTIRELSEDTGYKPSTLHLYRKIFEEYPTDADMEWLKEMAVSIFRMNQAIRVHNRGARDDLLTSLKNNRFDPNSTKLFLEELTRLKDNQARDDFDDAMKDTEVSPSKKQSVEEQEGARLSRNFVVADARMADALSKIKLAYEAMKQWKDIQGNLPADWEERIHDGITSLDTTIAELTVELIQFTEYHDKHFTIAGVAESGESTAGGKNA